MASGKKTSRSDNGLVIELPAPFKYQLKKLKAEDGDVVLIRKGSGLANYEFINQLAQMLPRGCMVAVVNEFSDLTVLGEHDMNAQGWYRMVGMGDPDDEGEPNA